jgi:hypothetical protein
MRRQRLWAAPRAHPYWLARLGGRPARWRRDTSRRPLAVPAGRHGDRLALHGIGLVSLLLALVLPGIGLLLGWAITAWALGRGLFVAVAMRRMGRQAAFQLYRRHRAAILLPGAALALAGTIPLVNLLVPILGTACMVHVLMRATATGKPA